MRSPFVALLALLALIPAAFSSGLVLGDTGSPLDGLAEASSETRYGYVITSGQFKGQVADPAVVLQLPPAERPPGEYRRMTCVSYSTDPEQPNLAERAAQVCEAEPVSEAEIRAEYPPSGPAGVGVPAA